MKIKMESIMKRNMNNISQNTFSINEKLEEDLNQHKKLLREYESQIDEMRRKNRSSISLVNNPPDNVLSHYPYNNYANNQKLDEANSSFFDNYKRNKVHIYTVYKKF
jgi:hypothetical protein